MNKIKDYLKWTKIYQLKKCSREYGRKISREYCGNRISKYCRIISNVKPIYLKKNDLHSKVVQITELFSRCHVDPLLKNGFFYSIDEKCIIYSNAMVIDNMPIDYGYIIDNSLESLKWNTGKADEYNAVLVCISDYIDRVCSVIHNSKMNSSDEIELVCNALQSIKKEKARSLFDALQRILFFNQLIWQSGHKLIGIGRLDKYLDKFEIDDKTENLLHSFLMTLHTYYNFKSSAMLGDTGQIVILGGLDCDGTYFYNAYTTMILDLIGKIKLPDPKVLLRCSKNMPEQLLEIAAKSIVLGIGSPLISNDEVVIRCLKEFGYEEEDAYNYGVSACWEPLSIANSLEQNNLYDIEFGLVLNQTICDQAFVNCTSFQDVFELYLHNLKKHISSLLEKVDSITWEYDPIMSLLMHCCKHRGKDVSEGGAKYNDYGLLSVGLGAAVNSLMNIRRLSYKLHKYNLENIQRAVKSDYKGYEELRSECCSLNEFGFGDNNIDAIDITNKIIDFSSGIVSEYKNRFNGKLKFGLSSPEYINKGNASGATFDGRYEGDPYDTHISCHNSKPITDLVLFASNLHYAGFSSNGNVIDTILQPDHIDENRCVNLIKGGIKTGIFQMQINVFSYFQLVEAKKHPEKYPDLIVRVWGFSSYFNDLPSEYQDLLIERARLML